MPRPNSKGPSGGSDDPERKAGKRVRLNFTDALKAAGLVGGEYATFTNAVYLHLFRATARALKARHGLSAKSGRLRDVLPPVWCAAVMMAEAGIAKRIIAEGAEGMSACMRIARDVIAVVRGAFLILA